MLTERSKWGAKELGSLGKLRQFLAGYKALFEIRGETVTLRHHGVATPEAVE